MQIPKPNHKRRKPKQGQLSKITPSVRVEVLERSEGKCERCGVTTAYSFEVAHLVQASQGGVGNDPKNVVLLCGPSVNSGTCHHFADYSKKGREWRMKKHDELKNYYD